MKNYFKNGACGLEMTSSLNGNCWINVENPTQEDKNYLLNELQIPEAFYNDIEDIDE